MSIRIISALTLATGVTAFPALAAQPAPPAAATSGKIETLVVTSHPLSAEGLALASEVLEGDELARKLESSIGETVGRQPGVHASSFGQAASRPVVHGLSGARVRVLEDRIDALDVSVTSADHAVTIEPFMANRIEILKGPSTLLYGSGAIGGVVDVHTGRIPHELPERSLSGRLEARRDDNGDRETAALRLDGGAGPIAWHLDGFTRDAEEYDIPSPAGSAALRALEGDEEPAESGGRLPGSHLNSDGGAVGVSWVGNRGFIGAAMSLLDSRYGLPGGHAHEHDEGEAAEEDHEEGTPLVDLEQTRFDLEAGLTDPLPGFTSLNVRVGVNDYRHAEIEPTGETASVFDNEAWEARVELSHEPLAGWNGALGVQLQDRKFSATGEEAFIAPVDTRSAGVFWVGERPFRRFDLEGGVRLERVSVDPSTGSNQDFTSYAASLGMVIPFGEAWSLGLSADLAARAPVAEELYSNGPHLSTGSFEVGDENLDEELALNLSANIRYAGERWFLSATAYRHDYRDFIYQAATGSEEDELPVFAYRQADATFVGLDLEARSTLASWENGSLEVNALFDTVDAELDISGNDHLPRIPATRYGLGLSGRWGVVRASVDHLWLRDQDDTAPFELPTPAYEDLRAYLGADLPMGDATVTLFVQGRNLTDEEQRQHTSFIKDLAPLPGRTVEAGIRARF